ncbi:hypothetical protein BDF14DRAFT_1809742 [Spinellus fusiger]|nr:hypothetical protein BDF14DRAFT_1809742 [Spinellus fusiger]
MSNKTYSVSTGAYAVPLLHAAKYPAATVCGVLLGKTDGSKVHVVSALPFFHHWTALTPMLEVALQQAEAYAAHQGLVIVGWYQANKRADDMTLHENAVRVCQTIQNNTQHAIAFVIDNRQLVHLDSVGALVVSGVVFIFYFFIYSFIIFVYLSFHTSQ